MPMLASLKTGKEFPCGLMVYTGRDVTANDIFAKLVDSGRQFKSVDETLADLDAYVQALGDFKIGNVLELLPCQELVRGFQLNKTEFRP